MCLLYSLLPQDWYSEEDSAIFTKTLIRLEGLNSLVVVDATEYGDVLVLAGAAFHQGVETPMESSTNTLDTCGQAFTFTFYIQVLLISKVTNGSSLLDNIILKNTYTQHIEGKVKFFRVCDPTPTSKKS